MIYRPKKNPIAKTQGFSLVEVLMAALVMMGLLIGTNRLVAQGMSTSGKAGQRSVIEQEILNDIEMIQEIDISILNSSSDLKAACTNISDSSSPEGSGGASSSNQGTPMPSEILKAKIEAELPAPGTQSSEDTDPSVQNNQGWTREINSKNADLLEVRYEFEIPESKGNREKRVIEINPSFATSCGLTS